MGLFDSEKVLDRFDVNKNPLSNAVASAGMGLLSRNRELGNNFYNNVLQSYAGINPKPLDQGLPVTDLFARTKQGLDLQKRSDSMMEALRKRIENGGSLDFIGIKNASDDKSELDTQRAQQQKFNDPSFGIDYSKWR
jgi:hypothetical protein